MILERNTNEIFSYDSISPDEAEIDSREGNVVDLLLNMRNIFLSKLMPNIDVINAILSKGTYDRGHQGRLKWRPFIVSETNFPQLVGDLLSRDSSVSYLAPDSWVKDTEDWSIWCLYVRKGIPWREHKKLNDSYLSIINKLETAKDLNNEQEISNLHLQSIDAGEALAKFVMENTKK